MLGNQHVGFPQVNGACRFVVIIVYVSWKVLELFFSRQHKEPEHRLYSMGHPAHVA